MPKILQIVLTVITFTAFNLLHSSVVNAQQVIEFEEIVVEGRIQKPEAFYILQHANLSYEHVNPKPSFLRELLNTVEEEEDLF